MFATFEFMAFNWCCIFGGPYYPTLPYLFLKFDMRSNRQENLICPDMHPGHLVGTLNTIKTNVALN